MKILYALTLIASLLVMNIFLIGGRKKQAPIMKILIKLVIAVTVTVLSSAFACLLPDETLALFMQTVHYASTEWMLIYLLLFMEEYTGRVESTRFTRIVCGMYAGLNTIQLILNVFFGHVVTAGYVYYKGTSYRMFTDYSPWYDLHEYYSYFLAVCCLLTLLRAAFTTIRFYRGKYNSALLALTVSIATEVVCAVYHTHLDYALYGYMFMGLFLIYYSVYHENKDIIDSTLAYVTTLSNNGVVCFDIDENCIFANEEIYKLYPEAGKLEDFHAIFSDQIYKNRFEDTDNQKWDIQLEREQGIVYLDVNFGKLYDSRGDYIGCYFYLYDKTLDEEKLKKERYRATHDMLTELYNREQFAERVGIMIYDAKKTYYLVAADIKDFKLINDLFGFARGNEILKEYSKLIREFATSRSVCCRMNSDRFAFCIPKEIFSEDALSDITQKVSEMIESKQYQLHIHYGIYEIQPGEKDVSVLYDRARMALRLIKDDYQRSISYYNDDMMNKMLREKQLVGEFEAALADNQFLMYLQPQVATDGTILGAEALVRWRHPELGMIPPGEFINVFERAGLIHELDQYMWEQAAKKLAQWKEQGKEQYHISVNISTKDFYYIDIYKTVTQLVEKYEIDASKLKLEITESAFMADQDKQLALIERLQEYGFHVEIDDFGSGYSSLNMLKDMKADVLKIDMGFLRKTQQEKRAKVILDMIVSLAKKLNMVVITEGVESREQVEYLIEVGCDMFQGFYFDRPIAVDDFEEKYLGE